MPPPNTQPFQAPGRGRNGRQTTRNARTPAANTTPAVQKRTATAPVPTRKDTPAAANTPTARGIPAQIEVTQVPEMRIRPPHVTPPKKDFGVGFNGFAVGKDQQSQA